MRRAPIPPPRRAPPPPRSLLRFARDAARTQDPGAPRARAHVSQYMVCAAIAHYASPAFCAVALDGSAPS